jgi:hypothetical protein
MHWAGLMPLRLQIRKLLMPFGAAPAARCGDPAAAKASALRSLCRHGLADPETILARLCPVVAGRPAPLLIT